MDIQSVRDRAQRTATVLNRTTAEDAARDLTRLLIHVVEMNVEIHEAVLGPNCETCAEAAIYVQALRHAAWVR